MATKAATKAAPKTTATKTAAKPAAAKPAAPKAVAKPAPKAAAKPASRATTAKPAPKAAPKAAPKPAAPKAAAKPKTAAVEAKVKAPKEKLVRDSFTMPEAEYAVLGQVKKTALKAGFEVKKSELLRVGVALISQIDLATLKKVLASLPQLKTGRPKKA